MVIAFPVTSISQKNDYRKTYGKKIQWNSGCFDEIGLVYDKAAEREITAKIRYDLEAGALAEANESR